MAHIISLFRASAPPRPRQEWSNQDLAELYRVEATLVQAGLRIDTERGESDEGHPWFVFCHADGGDVIAHFALIDGEYVVAAPALEGVLRGGNLDAIVRSFISENPVTLPKPEEQRDGNVIFHPAALLTVFVATLLLTAKPDESFAAGARHADAAPSIAEGTPDEAAVEQGEVLDANLDLDQNSTLRIDEARDHRSNEMALLLTVAVMASEMARFQAEAAEIADGAYLFREIAVTSIDLSNSPNPVQILEFDNPFDTQQPSGGNEGASGGLVSGGRPSSPSDTAPVIELGELAFVSGGRNGENKMHYPSELDATVITLGLDDANTREQLHEASAILSAEQDSSANQGRDSTPSRISADSETETPRLWLEGQEINISLVDRNAMVEAQKAIDIVDKGLSDESLDKEASDGSGDHWSDRLIEFDKDAQLAINHFLKSDDDIMAVERKDGSVVIFDHSDVKAGNLLKQHIWFFEDKTSIAIVGHADTVSEALGLVV